MIIKKLNKILRAKKIIIPAHQFGVRTTEIRNAFEKNNYYTAAFLDVTQAFDKLWHEVILYKLRQIVPSNFYHLLK